MAEAFAVPETRVRALDPPAGVDSESFSAYAFYVEDRLSKLALVNMKPFYANSTEDFSVHVDLSEAVSPNSGCLGLKRLTAPFVNTGNSSLVSWAGQSFPQGEAIGNVVVEMVGEDNAVDVRGSEAVLVFFDKGDIYGL
jgi:hypothetical protein